MVFGRNGQLLQFVVVVFNAPFLRSGKRGGGKDKKQRQKILKMSWRTSEVIGELNLGCFTTIIYDELTGDTIATVYGNSIEEAGERAEIIANSN